MDGTLIDTLSDIADSVNFVLEKYKFPKHSYSKYKIFIGDGIESLVMRALPKDLNLNREKIFNEIRVQYQENLNSKTVVYKGILDLLDFLLLKKIKIGICTNKPHDSALLCSKKYFDKYKIFTLGADHGFKIKPDPSGVKSILNRFRVNALESLFVGDSNIDIITAKNVGMSSVGVLWGFRKERELRDAGADFIFKHPKDLLKFLKTVIF
jgi:phosphoglycolate phosphatase